MRSKRTLFRHLLRARALTAAHAELVARGYTWIPEREQWETPGRSSRRVVVLTQPLEGGPWIARIITPPPSSRGAPPRLVGTYRRRDKK